MHVATRTPRLHPWFTPYGLELLFSWRTPRVPLGSFTGLGLPHPESVCEDAVMSCLCQESTTFHGISQQLSATVPCCSTLRAGLLLASISCTRIAVLTESQILSGRLPAQSRRQPTDTFFREPLVSWLVSAMRQLTQRTPWRALHTSNRREEPDTLTCGPKQWMYQPQVEHVIPGTCSAMRPFSNCQTPMPSFRMESLARHRPQDPRDVAVQSASRSLPAS